MPKYPYVQIVAQVEHILVSRHDQEVVQSSSELKHMVHVLLEYNN
ncbi:unnamed protein product [Linum tenue]|uniref:Uncharacterized protein n=1 Tax=Linum tenue TaxID=586396 RepID=A0AAV0PX50_9ROSI|nr:unnamed protein product [Linum tenue]